MHLVTAFVRDYSVEIILGLAALSLVLLVVMISLTIKLARFTKKRNAQLDSGQVGEIVDYITNQSHALASIEKKLYDISCRQDDLSCRMDTCVQGVGLVRFNAFEDVGGEQSFALALLDSSRTGVIISSLYGRQDCRVYIKSIKKGDSERTLSDEEKQALNAALSK